MVIGVALCLKPGRIDAVWPVVSGAFVANPGFGDFVSVYICGEHAFTEYS